MNDLLATTTRDPLASLTEGGEAFVSGWVEVTQAMVDGFAEATLDPDPMHIDPEWAAHGPFGGTIAFGFLTMSLLTRLLHLALGSDSAREPQTNGYYLNYGFDRLRLVSPVPVGRRVRGCFVLAERIRDEKGRMQAHFDCVIEIEGAERPALVARWLSLWVPPPTA